MYYHNVDKMRKTKNQDDDSGGKHDKNLNQDPFLPSTSHKDDNGRKHEPFLNHGNDIPSVLHKVDIGGKQSDSLNHGVPLSSDLCEVCQKRKFWATHCWDGNHKNKDPNNFIHVCQYCHNLLEGKDANLTEIKIHYETMKDLESLRKSVESRIRSMEQQWDLDAVDISDLKEIYNYVKKQEKTMEKKVINDGKEYEIYDWIVSNRGIAGKTASGIIAFYNNIKRFNTPTGMWNYAGLGCVDGKIQKHVKGEQSHFNPKLKSLLLGIIGKNFIRQKNSEYYSMYLYKKKYYKNNRPDWKKAKKGYKGHLDSAATRFMMKQFIVELFSQWKKLEGKETSCGS